MKAKWFRTILILMILVAAVVPSVGAAPLGDDNIPVAGSNSDNPGSPFSEKQFALKQQALEAKLNGQTNGNVHEVANGQFVELAREDTDKIFVVIAEFGNTRHSSFCDFGQVCAFPADGSAATYNGPLHNSIPQPNRSLDNSTLWKADYNPAHYQDMYFNRMAAYYESQSSGRYSVEGSVTEWVKVPFNEARYGRDYCGSIVCNNTWFLIRDALAFWVKGRLDAGWTMAQVTSYLQDFDEWDRYDSDGDGIFDESDGFIDHFQIVHAGGDQAAGDPQQGTDAIWSHRWYAQISGGGPNGFPGVNAGQGGVSSGQTIPNNPTGVWVGDYTIQPENGGLGVFAHEFGHDLGLPDLYDTSGNTGGGENSTGFWTLMSSGANIGDGGPNGIGDAPTDMGAWEKFQLGWLNYEVALPGQKSEHKLGPAETNTKQAQAVIVVLPDKPITSGAPYAGTYSYFSGTGDLIHNTMTRSVTLPAGTASLSAKVNYDIEEDWDFAFVTVNGSSVPTNLSSGGNLSGNNPLGHGITGTTDGNWEDLVVDLSTFAGQTVVIGFEYITDEAVSNPGFSVDEINISGQATDGAETDAGWTFDGFSVRALETNFFFNAYIAEFRQYRGYDTSLRTAYNFGFLNVNGDWVEHFPYQDGLLISYWDTSESDNNTSFHPGRGLILPIDAHPTAMYRGATVWRSRIQSFDSTFTLAPTDAITVNFNSVPYSFASQAAVKIFNDLTQYWNPLTPTAGVINPNTGTTIRIKSISAQGAFMQISINK